MKTFGEISNVKLDTSDRNTLVVLAHSRGWGKLRRIVEDYTLQLTHNLIVGTESEKDSSVEELKALRGFVRYWAKIVDLVENEEHHKKDEPEKTES